MVIAGVVASVALKVQPGGTEALVTVQTPDALSAGRIMIGPQVPSGVITVKCSSLRVVAFNTGDIQGRSEAVVLTQAASPAENAAVKVLALPLDKVLPVIVRVQLITDPAAVLIVAGPVAVYAVFRGETE